MLSFKPKQRPRNEGYSSNPTRIIEDALPSIIPGMRHNRMELSPQGLGSHKRDRRGPARAHISVENHTVTSYSAEFLRIDGQAVKPRRKAKSKQLTLKVSSKQLS